MYEEDGYHVLRAAGSLGIFDLVAIHPRQLVFIQCKCNAWPRRSEMQAMEAFGATLPESYRVIVYRKDDQKSPGKPAPPQRQKVLVDAVWHEVVEDVVPF